MRKLKSQSERNFRPGRKFVRFVLSFTGQGTNLLAEWLRSFLNKWEKKKQDLSRMEATLLAGQHGTNLTVQNLDV